MQKASDDEILDRAAEICGGTVRSLIVLLSLTFSAAILDAQSSAPREFEVASVKPNNSGASSWSAQTETDGSYRAQNVTAQSVIMTAFDLQSFAIVGGPAWLDSDRFDIIGRPAAGARESDIPAMLQALLRSRFALTAHTELRDVPIYNLELARSDRQLGPQLTPTNRNCVDERANGPELAPRSGIPACGVSRSVGNVGNILRGGGRTMMDLATALGNAAGVSRQVVEQTGVTGAFDFELRWASVSSQAGGSGAEQVSIFTAVQEQLGLKLVSGRGRAEVLVIDHIERPSDN
jgi:uncharacterized protein (TIGR03435 family)